MVRLVVAAALIAIVLVVAFLYGRFVPGWISVPGILIVVTAVVDALLAAGALLANERRPTKGAPAPVASVPSQPGSDMPIADESFDELGHLKFAYVLARHIVKTKPPTTIGIHGKWGTGKTSLGNLIAALLKPRDDPDQKPDRWSDFDKSLQAAGEKSMDNDLPNDLLRQLTIFRFNAWQYASADSLWRALILELASRVDERGDAEASEEWKRRLYYSVSQDRRGEVKLNSGAIVAAGLKATALFVSAAALPSGWIGAGLKLVGATSQGEQLLPSLSSVFEREKFTEMREQMKSVEEFQGAFRDLVSELLKRGGIKASPDARVVFFIDDLDRCLPTVALEIMETIKTFLDVPGCVYVLMCDQELLGQGVRAKFEQVFATDAMQRSRGREYVEKIIQVSFSIPPPRTDDLKKLVTTAVTANGGDDPIVYFEIAHSAVGDNPRRLKRLCIGLELAYQMMRTNQAQANGAPQISPNGGNPLTLNAVKQEFAKVYCLSVAWPEATDYLTEFQRSGEVPSIVDPDFPDDNPNVKAAANREADLLSGNDRLIFGDLLVTVDWTTAEQLGQDAVRLVNRELHDFLGTKPAFSEMGPERLGDYLLWTATLPSTSEPSAPSAARPERYPIPFENPVVTSEVGSRVSGRPRRVVAKKK